MKKENLFKLLNKGKRLNHFEPVKPKKHTLKSIVYKYTGLKVLKAFESLLEGLKEDLTIIFKPTKRFTKKDLKGVDVMSLNAKYVLEQAERDKKDLSTIDKSSKVLSTMDKSSDDGFVNWFEVGQATQPSSENTKCTYTDKYGNKVSLDESFEALKRENY